MVDSCPSTSVPTEQNSDVLVAIHKDLTLPTSYFQPKERGKEYQQGQTEIKQDGHCPPLGQTS
jgi:hypothetical protein